MFIPKFVWEKGKRSVCPLHCTDRGNVTLNTTLTLTMSLTLTDPKPTPNLKPNSNPNPKV